MVPAGCIVQENSHAADAHTWRNYVYKIRRRGNQHEMKDFLSEAHQAEQRTVIAGRIYQPDQLNHHGNYQPTVVAALQCVQDTF